MVDYLHKRGLTERYQKAKRLLSDDLFGAVSLKKRNPKPAGVWYFRINKQYRALCIREKDTLIVFSIDDHQ